MIISIDEQKAFDKLQHPFMIKTLQNMGIEGNYLNTVKTIYDRPTENLNKKLQPVSGSQAQTLAPHLKAVLGSE